MGVRHQAQPNQLPPRQPLRDCQGAPTTFTTPGSAARRRASTPCSSPYPTVRFRTWDEDGPPAPDPAACAARSSGLNIPERCVLNSIPHPDTGDTGDTGDTSR